MIHMIILLWLFLIPVGTIALGAKLKRHSFRFSGIALCVLIAGFIATSAWPRFVPALDDNAPFSIPMDYRDRYMHGFPFGFWCRYASPELDRTPKTFNQFVVHHVDPRGLAIGAVFWGHLGLSLCLPAIVHFLRTRKLKESSNKPDARDGL